MSSSIKYEEGIKKIDEIITKLENGDIELEKSIELYKEAFSTIEKCRNILNSAEGKIKQINDKKNGEIEFTDFK